MYHFYGKHLLLYSVFLELKTGLKYRRVALEVKQFLLFATNFAHYALNSQSGSVEFDARAELQSKRQKC